jgi:hypothetical protein
MITSTIKNINLIVFKKIIKKKEIEANAARRDAPFRACSSN